jgi:hypothetical protein
VASSVIVVVVGSLFALLMLFIWAISGLSEWAARFGPPGERLFERLELQGVGAVRVDTGLGPNSRSAQYGQ